MKDFDEWLAKEVELTLKRWELDPKEHIATRASDQAALNVIINLLQHAVNSGQISLPSNPAKA